MNVLELLEKNKSTFISCLEGSIDINRFMSMSYNLLRVNPELAECSADSLIDAFTKAAELGLEPGFNGLCDIIPRWNKNTKRKEAVFQIRYTGLIELFYRHPLAVKIEAHAVFVNDYFEYELGLEQKLVHRPKLGERGKAIGYYAIAKIKDADPQIYVMGYEEVKEHQKLWGAGGSSWTTAFDEMAKKTVLKKVMKYLPKTGKLNEKLERIDNNRNLLEYNNSTGEILEVEHRHQQQIESLPETQKTGNNNKPSQDILKKAYEATTLLNNLVKQKKLTEDTAKSYREDIEVFKETNNTAGMLDLINTFSEMIKPGKQQQQAPKSSKSPIDQLKEDIINALARLIDHEPYCNEGYVENMFINALGFDSVDKCQNEQLLSDLLDKLNADLTSLPS